MTENTNTKTPLVVLENTVKVGKREYILQHPGNRAWLKLQKKIFNAKTSEFDAEALLDYCFEHVVHPLEGVKLSLDDIHPSELGEWQTILPRFLRGLDISSSGREEAA